MSVMNHLVWPTLGSALLFAFSPATGPASQPPIARFEAARAALGDREVLRSLKSLSLRGERRAYNAAGPGAGGPQYLDHAVTISILLPDYFLKDTFVGARATPFRSGLRADRTLTGRPASADEQAGVARLLLALLLHPHRYADVKLSAPSAANGLLFTGRDRFDTTVEFGEQGLPIRLRWRQPIRNRGTVIEDATMELFDHKVIGGLRLPHRIHLTRGTQRLEDLTFTEILLNPKLTPADFGGQ